MSVEPVAEERGPGSLPTNSLSGDPELLNDFILESREHLTAIELHLLTLDQDGADSEALHAIFRGFHTIKGMAGFLDLHAVRDVAHEVETILDLARSSQLTITSAVIDRILESKDYLNHWLSEIETMLASGRAPLAPDNRILLAGIRSLSSARPPEDMNADARIVHASVVHSSEDDAVIASLSGLGQTNAAIETTETAKPAEARQRGARSIKVETAKLDFLVDMVGEMMIAQAMVRHDPELGLGVKPGLTRNLSQLARIIDEVQRTAMSMRMIPVGQLFQKTARLVRDLSRKSGKLVELDLEGEETELDRNIVEDLADPLMHMVRNAIDHGIEAPAERVRSGKTATARVTLKAGHQAGHILIQVRDDGRGLNAAKILQKARDKGLIATNAQLSESEIIALIFQPGFSTAETITDVSGRGVGMDVVRKQIQRLRGRVDIESVLGQGTTFRMKLPLTLAIIDGLVVGVGGQRYIVPIFAIREMLKPSEAQICTFQGRQEMALVRGALLPIVRLHRRFGVNTRYSEPWESLLIVSESAGKQFCLMVDELIGKQEVVIKSLGETMRKIEGVAGGAILGDGRVGLILDMEGLLGGHRNE